MLSPPVLLVLCAPEPAGLLRLPADQQHRQTLPHALHRAALPSDHGGAQSEPVWQPGPAGHGKRLHFSVSLIRFLSFYAFLQRLEKVLTSELLLSVLLLTANTRTGQGECIMAEHCHLFNLHTNITTMSCRQQMMIMMIMRQHPDGSRLELLRCCWISPQAFVFAIWAWLFWAALPQHKPLKSSYIHACVCVCANLQLCGRHQGSSEDHDPSGDHGLRARPLPARSAGGVHSQAGLPLETAGWLKDADWLLPTTNLTWRF